jgi:hypothetical protein
MEITFLMVLKKPIHGQFGKRYMAWYPKTHLKSKSRGLRLIFCSSK